MTPAVTRSLVSDQVFRILCEGILSGRYEPGEKLPTQRTLAADLGVNMAPMREAVKRLEQLGLVNVRHGDAMRVRNWRHDAGLDVVAQLLLGAGGADPGTLRALLEARRLMLREAARLAAARRSEAQAARLVELARAVAAAPDAAAAQALDFEFMTELVESAANLVFTLILNTVRKLYFEHAPLFEAVVADSAALAPHYAAGAAAVGAREADLAAAEIDALAGAQERALAEALG